LVGAFLTSLYSFRMVFLTFSENRSRVKEVCLASNGRVGDSLIGLASLSVWAGSSRFPHLGAPPGSPVFHTALPVHMIPQAVPV